MEHVRAVARVKAAADARQKRELKAGEREKLTEMPPLPQTYHWAALRRAYEYHRASDAYPFNPRCLRPERLEDIDQAWVADYECYCAWIQYLVDNPRAKLPDRGRAAARS